MSVKFGIALPQGTLLEFAGIADPVEAYETMTQVAVTAEEVGFDSLWLSDALWPGDSSQFLFECWTTTAALARDTKRVRIVFFSSAVVALSFAGQYTVGVIFALLTVLFLVLTYTLGNPAWAK